MSYLWFPALAIKVDTNTHVPLAFELNTRRFQVRWVSEHWRVDVEWWEERIWRDYFLLVTKSGLLVELYHDLLSDEWYLQRIYD